MFPSARIPSVCAACEQSSALEVGQSIQRGRLRWYERFACSCGHGFEAGGAGSPPPVLRRALLSQAGEAQLSLDSVPQDPRVAQALVSVLGLSEDEAAARLGLPPPISLRATHAEAALLVFLLAPLGLKVQGTYQLPLASEPGGADS